MAHQARFHNSALAIAIALFLGCNSHRQETAGYRILDKSKNTFTLTNGVMQWHGRNFSGTVYSLYAGTNDTSEVSGYLQGKEHGTWKKFYGDGRPKEIREFNNGNKTGTYMAWWENGNTKLKYVFEDGEYNGTCSEWNYKGTLVKEMNYKKGYEDGSQKMFFDNGKIRSNYVIKNGRRYGLLGTKNCINVSDSIFKN